MTASQDFMQQREQRKQLAVELQANVDRLVDLLRRQRELESELARVRTDAGDLAERRIFNGNFLTSDGRYFVTISDGVATWHEVHAPEQWADDVLERGAS